MTAGDGESNPLGVGRKLGVGNPEQLVEVLDLKGFCPAKRGEQRAKNETRNPKSEIRKKAETRNPKRPGLANEWGQTSSLRSFWTAPVVWRFGFLRVGWKSARGLAQSKSFAGYSFALIRLRLPSEPLFSGL
jgi:hypothetical protein